MLDVSGCDTVSVKDRREDTLSWSMDVDEGSGGVEVGVEGVESRKGGLEVSSEDVDTEPKTTSATKTPTENENQLTGKHQSS